MFSSEDNKYTIHLFTGTKRYLFCGDKYGPNVAPILTWRKFPVLAIYFHSIIIVDISSDITSNLI